MSPQSPAAVVLIPFVVVIFAAARPVARRVTLDPIFGRVAAPAIAVALWLLGVHVIGLVTHSFTRGMWAGTLAVGTAAGILLWFDRRRPRDHDARLPLAMWLPACAALLLFLPAAFRFAFHDELWISGHQAFASQIQNGIYPPRHGQFADCLLRYHYGFDLLVALVSTLTRLSVERSIDAVTAAGWFYAWCLGWGLGERLCGAGRGWILPITLLLNGPFALLGEPYGAPAGLHRWFGLVTVDRAVLNPSIVSYFFQHPWSIGIPLTLTILGLGLDRQPGASKWRFSVLLVLFLCLSICHFVLFCTLLAALGVVQVASNARAAWRTAVAWGGLMVVSVGVASRLGGFFASVPEVSYGLKFSPWSQTGRVATNLLWDLASLGFALPLGIIGIVLLLRRSTAWGLVLACLASGSIVVVNAMKYEHSWDISKFGTVAALALGMASGVALAQLVAARRRVLALPLAALLLAGVAVPGAGFLACLAHPAKNLPVFFFPSPPPVDADHAATISWLRQHIRAGEIVFSPPEVAPRYAQLGGLPELQIDGATEGFGFPPEWVQRRRVIAVQTPSDPVTYKGVRWIVVPDRSTLLPRKRLAEWQQAGRLVPVARFGAVQVFEVAARH